MNGDENLRDIAMKLVISYIDTSGLAFQNNSNKGILENLAYTKPLGVYLSCTYAVRNQHDGEEHDAIIYYEKFTSFFIQK